MREQLLGSDADMRSPGRLSPAPPGDDCAPLDLSTLHYPGSCGTNGIVTLSRPSSPAADAPQKAGPFPHSPCCVTAQLSDLHPLSCSDSTAANDTPSDFDGDPHWREDDVRGPAHRRRSSSCLYSDEQEAPPSSPGPRSCDFERFQHEVAPSLPADISYPLRSAAKRSTLQDLWDWYFLPSLYGKEVVTCGGGPTESSAFFVPFVSAVQLFAYDSGPEPAKPRTKRYECQVPGWPQRMKLLCEYRARQYPWERMPAHSLLQHLATMRPSELIPDPARLKSTHLSDLHPCSWFSIAWWPLYRIPEARLEASFLVFHSLSAIHHQVEAPDARACSLELPVAGVLWHKTERERWLHTARLGGGARVSVTGVDDAPDTESLPDVDMMFQAHLAELHGTAKRLALGLDVECTNVAGVAVDPPSHGDYEWFSTRRG